MINPDKTTSITQVSEGSEGSRGVKEVNWATQVGEIAANEMLSGTASVGAARSIQISTNI